MKAVYVSHRDPIVAKRLALKPVAEVMSHPAVTVAAGTRLDDALTTMIRAGLRHLVVVDDHGRCLGVLSDRMIVSTWASDFDALSHRTAQAVLDRVPAAVSLGDTVLVTARLMCSTNTDAVAVVDARGHAVGVVTGRDLVALLTV